MIKMTLSLNLKKKKLFLVKREVLARNIKEAITAKGVIYEIQTVDEKSQPVDEKKIGFEK